MVKQIALIALIIIIIGIGVAHVNAQSGVCPDNTNEIQIPPGTYPGGTQPCTEDSARQYLRIDADAPCGGGIQDDDTSILNGHLPIYMVYISPQQFPSGQARLRFIFTGWNAAGYSYLATNNDPISWQVDSFNPARQNIDTVVVSHTAGTHIQGTNFCAPDAIICSGPGHYYQMEIVFDAVQNGYATLLVSSPPHISMPDYFYTSFQITDSSQPLPDHCQIPGAPTPTPSPTSTNTPGPTSTPTHTPTLDPSQTPDPTNTPGPPTNTPQHTPTNTPTLYPSQPPPSITYTPHATGTIPPLNTMPAEATPTPWGAYIIPTISWPTIPSSQGQPTPAGFGDLTALGDEIATIEAGLETDIDTTLTETTGIAAPTAIAAFITTNLSEPISYLKAVGFYLPNLWIYIAAFMLMAAWIVFNVFAKYMSGLVKVIYDLLKTLLDTILGPLLKAAAALFGL